VSPPPAGPQQDRPPQRARGPQQRTAPRSQLAQRAHFAEVSPEVGVLDEQAFAQALERDADGALTLLVEMGSATDERLRAAARALAGRVVLDRARAGLPRRSGVGRLQRQSADLGGDLDVEASLDGLLEARASRRRPAADSLVAVDWGRPELALCLLVDASGSMGGARLAAAALTAAACALRAPGDCAVLSFAREVTVVSPMDGARPPGQVVDAVLALRGHGVTSLTAALRAAGEQLARTRAARRVVVLLSDCRSTDDQDPTALARALPELVVLAPADDSDEAAALAARSGARMLPLAGAAAAPAALRELLG
jgi:Mg-chelatase subunit ChlD